MLLCAVGVRGRAPPAPPVAVWEMKLFQRLELNNAYIYLEIGTVDRMRMVAPLAVFEHPEADPVNPEAPASAGCASAPVWLSHCLAPAPLAASGLQPGMRGPPILIGAALALAAPGAVDPCCFAALR